jgi:hypothetical protein
MLILAELVGTVPEKFERLNRKVAFISAAARDGRMIRAEIAEIRIMFLTLFILFLCYKLYFEMAR